VHGRGFAAPARWAAVAVALVALTGCGEDTRGQDAEGASSPASPSPSASNGAPDCADVWRDGEELPRAYAGCNSDEGFVAAEKLGCSSGQRMVSYGDHFYAVLGGTIHGTESPLEDDRGYRDAVASCRA
jgi:hypothetical protein